ncbi:VWA domain-containing protein [Flavitalea flava]
MVRLEHIEYLLGLIVIPLLGVIFFWLLKWKKKTTAKIGDPLLVRQLVKNFSRGRFLIKAILALSALTFLILGAANLQKPGLKENIRREGVDVMLVLDVSKSMLARDIKPSRLDRAKQLLIRLADKLDNDRLGLVLFAGRAYLQMPLTTDHGAARMYIRDAGPDVVPTQGTVIAEALKMANTSFNSKEHKYKAIVLLSDGEDHDPEALKAAKALAESGVMINTVGIGSPEGSPIVDPVTNELKKDEQGQTVISKLNEPELQQLADASNGKYLRLDNVDDALITLTGQLESIEKKTLNDAEFVDYKNYFQWFLGLALVLLLAEYFIPERRSERGMDRQQLKKPSVSPLSLFPAIVLFTGLFAGLSLCASAQKENALIRSGNRLYKKKQIDQSQKEYQEAVREAPDNAAANYNLGNAFFRKNNFEEAAKSYDASVQHSADNVVREKGFYNKGVAHIKQQKLAESIDSWKNALKLDPSDEEARENLQKALIELKKQQSQQQKNQKDQKDKKDKKDQKDQKDEKKDQDQKKQQQPKPQPSRLNKQQVEQLLKALQQKENEAQEKMNQNKVKSSSQPEKDW